jgi:hypothetical protein
MYVLWFKKPMDIRSELVVHDILLDTVRTESRSSRALNLKGTPITDTTDTTAWGLIIFLTTICALYGGIHLSSWNFDFPSNTERLLWKISGIITVSASLLTPGWLIWMEWIFDSGFVHAMRNLLFGWSGSTPGGNILRIYICIVVVTSPVLIAARLFLVIESFISLRDVPAGAYATVPWAQYIPHI